MNSGRRKPGRQLIYAGSVASGYLAVPPWLFFVLQEAQTIGVSLSNWCLLVSHSRSFACGNKTEAMLPHATCLRSAVLA
jgi:hypothetical protein